MRRAIVVLGLLSCQQHEPVVGKAYLIEATGTRPAPEGPTIEVGKTEIPAKLTGPVRVAIDRDLPYPAAVEALQKIRAAGGEPYPLVAVRDRVEALVPPEPKVAGSINVWADPDGRACVAPHDSPTATCVHPKASKHVDRAFVRDLVYKAVREYDVKSIHVKIDPSLNWGDAVRAIDGSRTCCTEDTGPIHVSVEPGW
jgi:hypothetical protein